VFQDATSSSPSTAGAAPRCTRQPSGMAADGRSPGPRPALPNAVLDAPCAGTRTTTTCTS
jgi:hypothetical protein